MKSLRSLIESHEFRLSVFFGKRIPHRIDEKVMRIGKIGLDEIERSVPERMHAHAAERKETARNAVRFLARAFKRQHGTRNVPAEKLLLFRGDASVDSEKVVIGKLRFFSAIDESEIISAERVVFEILYAVASIPRINEELVPRLRRSIRMHIALSERQRVFPPPRNIVLKNDLIIEIGRASCRERV